MFSGKNTLESFHLVGVYILNEMKNKKCKSQSHRKIMQNNNLVWRYSIVYQEETGTAY